MLTFEWNPSSINRGQYLELLNHAYGGGWDERKLAWYMSRRYAGRIPDTVVLFEDGRPAAGLCVNYRTIRTADNATIKAGIITAAWTSPHAQGRSYFKKVVDELVDGTDTNDCELLLGFVTADNPSRAGMATVGSTMISSAYLVARPGEFAIKRKYQVPITDCTASAEELFAMHSVEDDVARFHYDSLVDWQSQFLDRPDSTHVLQVGSNCVAIIESTPDTDRLQWFAGDSTEQIAAVASICNRSLAAGRNFFTFGCDDWAKSCASPAGLELRRGSITCLATSASGNVQEAATDSRWQVFSGDRM